MGFGVWGLGFGVWGLGFGVCGFFGSGFEACIFSVSPQVFVFSVSPW